MLLYTPQDLPIAERLKDHRFQWLDELGAVDIAETPPDASGFFFGYAHENRDDWQAVLDRPNVCDQPQQHAELLRLPDILQRLGEHKVQVPTPRTWVIGVDDSIPSDLAFPLFVRTPRSSWKRGGDQSRANNITELEEEMELLRRAFGWDTPIVAREWIHVAVAGSWMFGDAPQEIRVWVIDGAPTAWSFHYLHAVTNPQGFPPSTADLAKLEDWAASVASPFSARLIVADFIRDRAGEWHFLEAGPGAFAGTGHESVFKYVASRMVGEAYALQANHVGGPLGD